MLSAIVITRNEEMKIKRCLNGLKFADEIIVVDSGSNDDTCERAKKMGAKVYQRDWQGYGAQKNYGALQATGDWLLFIDADEVVSGKLAHEISDTIKKPGIKTVDQCSFYWIRIVTVFLGKPLRHLMGHNPRLFRKQAGHWTNARVHEQVENSAGQTVKLGDELSEVLHAPLLHHSHADLRSYIIKMHYYTALDAAQMAADGKHRSGRAVSPTWWLPAYLMARQFTKLFFYRRGVLDGYAGWAWCLLSSYYEWEMGRKYLQLKKANQNKIQPEKHTF